MRPRFLLLPLGFAAALLAGCHHGAGSEADQEANAVVSVQAEPVVQGDLKHWVRGEAVLSPVDEQVITAKINAPVAKFYVQRGSHVRAGEVVADLENRDLTAAAAEAQSNYQTAQANYQTATAANLPEQLQAAELDAATKQQALQNAQSVYDSRKGLFDQGAMPKRDLDAAALDLANARAAAAEASRHLEGLQKVGNENAIRAANGEMSAAQAHAQGADATLNYSHIVSAINGVVTDRPLYEGEMASDTSPLMTIMDLSSVYAKTNLPTADAQQLKVGDAAQLTPVGGNKPYEGTVSVVSPAADPGSTTVQVWVKAANPGETLRPGTPVTVAILAETLHNVLTIPAPALLVDPGGATSVMIAGDDGRAHEQDVQVGVREPDRVQITGGLKAGQKVITSGAFGLDDKTRIKVVAPPDVDEPDGI